MTSYIEHVLKLVRDTGSTGATSIEIAEQTSFAVNFASSMLRNLEIQGKVRRLKIKRAPKENMRAATVFVAVSEEEIAQAFDAKESKDPRAFWADILRRIKDFSSTRNARHLDEFTLQRYLKEFEADLKEAVRHFTDRANNAGNRAHGEALAAIPRRQVLDACRVLQIPPPKEGKPVDLVLAKKMKRKLVQAYHPDTNPNASPEMISMCQATTESFDLCENYNHVLQAKGVRA